MKANIIQPVIGMFVEERNASNLNELLSSWSPEEVAALIDQFLDEEERFFIFESLPHDLAAQTFEYLEVEYQKEFLEQLRPERVPKQAMKLDQKIELLKNHQ